MPMARTISITLRIFSGIPFLVGSAAFAWGIFCFLGGPEGRPWSAAALIAWGISWTVAAACAGIYLLLNRVSARARREQASSANPVRKRSAVPFE